jgi:small subunit ribosomal protein S17
MEKSAESRGRKAEFVGEVVSDKMDKTISVLVYRQIRHAKYGKYLRKSSIMKAHDEKNVAKEGDKVRISESRPLSKTKRFRLVEVLESTKSKG